MVTYVYTIEHTRDLKKEPAAIPTPAANIVCFCFVHSSELKNYQPDVVTCEFNVDGADNMMGNMVRIEGVSDETHTGRVSGVSSSRSFTTCGVHVRVLCWYLLSDSRRANGTDNQMVPIYTCTKVIPRRPIYAHALSR